MNVTDEVSQDLIISYSYYKSYTYYIYIKHVYGIIMCTKCQGHYFFRLQVLPYLLICMFRCRWTWMSFHISKYKYQSQRSNHNSNDSELWHDYQSARPSLMWSQTIHFHSRHLYSQIYHKILLCQYYADQGFIKYLYILKDSIKYKD